MKKSLMSMAVVVLVAVTILAMGFLFSQDGAQAAADAAQGRITVSGQGVIKVQPDIAYVTVGVQTESKDAKEAQKENTERMNSVIAAVKALGIAEKDIQTSGYYMYPQYNYDGKEQTVTGYTVSNSVTVKARDIKKVGDVIDVSVAAGANVASNIQFSVADPTPYYQQALTAAMENAQAKGETIAGALGVSVGLPLEVAEQSSYYAPTTRNYESSAAYGAVADTSIQAGELEVSATVQVTYGY